MFELKYAPYDLLSQKVEPFDFSKQDPEKIEKDMIEVMQMHHGVGLAANQIGLNSRVFVAGSDNINGFIKPRAFFNPVILKVSDDVGISQEGCLSFPGLWLKVKRPEWIEVAYHDIKGNVVEARVDGYLAKVFQHEHDHLEGICFIDRVSRLSFYMAQKKLAKKNRMRGQYQ